MLFCTFIILKFHYNIIQIIYFIKNTKQTEYSSFNCQSPFNRIKQNKKIEDHTMKHKLTNSTIKTSKSSHVLTSNARIIKLIQDKKYPLRIAQKSELIFPKIREKIKRIETHPQQKAKRYVQINLKDEETNPFVPIPQQQLWQKYRIRSKSPQQSHINNNNHSNSYLQVIQNQDIQRQQQINKNKNNLFHSNSYFNLIEGEQTLHTKQYRSMITQQSQKNNSFLDKIRESISSRKIHYLKNVKYSEILSEGNEKENYSFQYIVNKIEAKNRKDPNLFKKSAYESLSPNRLKDYIDIFSSSRQNRNIVQNKQKDQKQINKTDQKIENEGSSILDNCSSFITESLPSAKQRLKVKLIKMIETKHKI